MRTGSAVPTMIGMDVVVCKGEANLMEMRTECAGPVARTGARMAMTGGGFGVDQ
jgi:hypothetical protein